MKKLLLYVIPIGAVIILVIQMGLLTSFGIQPIGLKREENEENFSNRDVYDYAKEDDIKYRVKAEGDYFYVYKSGQWEKMFIKGVNIGAGEPGSFPGELTITYETYYRWFEEISAMNANCIRVYTTLRPQFYKALYDFNSKSENPLYLFHGVWMNEEDITSLNDVYANNKQILTEFKQDAMNLVDVIHGNISLPQRAGFADGTYTADVSKWFAGWIIGIEWDPKFVQNTNDLNPDKNSFEGSYLYTQGASAFESFLCEVGNDVIEYETEKYKFQSPVAFTNWVTTDPISHPDEPHQDEDLVSVNMENIKSRNSFMPNMFISYHIYPYYPDSLNYQRDYKEFMDSTGKVNPYEAYLRDLKMAHTLPIVVSEFGLPTSRGMGHESIMGYTQGFIDETEQGDYLLDMFNSIYEEDYAGGIVFTWQDEWFKRTWNNVKFDIPDRRPFWSNIQTTEQCFGILSFDPGANTKICYVDGNVSDWANDKPITTSDNGKLYAKCDERYVYFMLDLKEYDFDNDVLLIPIDTKQKQGNNKYKDRNVSFDKQAEFVIEINGKDNSRILVDQYYDPFYYLYGEQYKMISEMDDIRAKNTGEFNKSMMCYGYEFTIASTGLEVPFMSFETGLLTYGNNNPNEDEYKSLVDFCYKDGKLEIQIPWQLLNVMDPSQKKNMDDFYKEQMITPSGFENFNIGFGIQRLEKTISLDGVLNYKTWTMPAYHERLKSSYYVLQEGLKQYE